VLKNRSLALTSDQSNWSYDTRQLLYQIYFVLNALHSEFTHYDLHTRNVLLYKPFKGNQCVQLVYYDINGDITRKAYSEWICKIIDYGRCHYPNARKKLERICETCKNCGMQDGFAMTIEPLFDSRRGIDITKNGYLENNYYINPLVANPSHDLTLMHHIELLHYKMSSQFSIPPVHPAHFGLQNYSHLLPFPATIRRKKPIVSTVMDAEKALREPYEGRSRENRYVDEQWEVKAVLHIYSDGRDYTYEEFDDIVLAT
jgi:hypothetical protein